jgi:hypothetical protein
MLICERSQGAVQIDVEPGLSSPLTLLAGPRVRIRLPPAGSLQTFRPLRVAAIASVAEPEAGPQVRVGLRVRIRFPPAASLQTLGPSI